MGPDRFCDLVMKGGVTSGIVYPRAVLELTRRYRFKNIGGTSAGAIAAAVVAAAALGERRLKIDESRSWPDGTGMVGLSQVSEELCTEGTVARLFQPSPAARAPYRLLTRWPGSGKVGRLFEPVRAVVALAWLPMVTVLTALALLAFLVGGIRGIISASAPLLMCVAVTGIVAALLRTMRIVSGNMLGLCSGLSNDGGGPEALTNWMHRMIRALAGDADAEGRPVTFGDLWNAPAYPDEPEGDRRLNLQIITTDLSHSGPRTLPFTQGGLFFREDEFDRLFPKTVVGWMRQRSVGRRVVDGFDYWALPDAADLPVVVAARMSLSFPLLISAVPLHEVDISAPWSKDAPQASRDAEPKHEEARPVRLAEEMDSLAVPIAGDSRVATDPTRPMRRCWFTDGGVSSNFPIHLFDSPLPRWPTFAIDLLYPGKDVIEQPVFLPKNNNQGLRPGYRRITGDSGIVDVVRFLGGIIGTMQNWRDLLLGRAPGYRDRIVRVSLGKNEGGMNILMPQSVLTDVAAKGAEAGRVLAADFDFDNHYWVRHRSSASAIERFVISYAKGLQDPLHVSYEAAWRRAWDPGRGVAGPYRFTAAQSEESVRRIRLLRSEGDLWADTTTSLTEGAPRPLPELRVSPTF